jgi:uncharacterized membrane protein YhaH (DUF805 family)
MLMRARGEQQTAQLGHDTGDPMSFGESIRTCFTKYATFTGRATRPEFWFFALFTLIVEIVVAIIDAAIGNTILGIIVGLALLLPTLAVSARRLHDTDRSGWWILIGIIPLIGTIILIVFYCQDTRGGYQDQAATPQTSY